MEWIKRNYWDPQPLKDLLQSIGMPQTDFAEACASIGISKGSALMYLAGSSTPGLERLIAIADALGVSLDYLTGRMTREESEKFLEIYPSCFMQMRRGPYEFYLYGRKSASFDTGRSSIESPWPYNLYDAVSGGRYNAKEKWDTLLTDDQIRGMYQALETLTDRTREMIFLYYRDGLYLDQIGTRAGLSRERVRQIIVKGIRRLRHPSRFNLMRYGPEYMAAENELNQRWKELRLNQLALDKWEEDLCAKRAGLEEEKRCADISTPQNTRRSISLSDMDLSVRSYNCLARAGCETLQDVLDLAESGEMIGLRNLGRKSYDEITGKLYELTGVASMRQEKG